jgi:UDP-N-acetyl-D-galactosamine dehydrogenase
MILAGRRINDHMGEYVAAQFVKAMLKQQITVKGARVLIMGLTFKENCPDLRNTKVVDIVRELKDYNVNVEVYDPWVDAAAARDEYGIEPIAEPEGGGYDGIVLAVAHREFAVMSEAELRALGRERHVLYDLKNVLPSTSSDLRL